MELISFLCGLSVMVLELAGMRIITPFLSSNFIVWTSVIGIIMVSLSFGYYFGGKLSDKNPTANRLSLIIFLAGLYILVIAVFQFQFLKFITETIDINIYYLSIIVAIVMFTIPSFLLGIVSPYLIKYVIIDRSIPENKIGSTVGKFYAISTIGSIIGTFLCGFILIIFLGIETIFYGLSFILFLCAFICIVKKKYKLKKSLLLIYTSFILISLFFIIYYKKNPAQIIQNSIYSTNSPYQYLSVVEEKTNEGQIIRFLKTNNKKGAYSSKEINLEPKIYNNHYHKIFLDFYILKELKQNILILGNAGGIFLNSVLSDINKNTKQSVESTKFEKFKNIHIDVVEIDKYTTQIAKKYFNLQKSNQVTFFHQDARYFINKKSKLNSNKYNLVYYDIFLDSPICPYYLITREAIEKYKKIMSDDGIFIMNIIGSPSGIFNDYMRQVYTQFNKSFEVVNILDFKEIYKLNNKNAISNYVLVAYKNPNSIESVKIRKYFEKFIYKDIIVTNEVLTDNYAPIEKYLFW